MMIVLENGNEHDSPFENCSVPLLQLLVDSPVLEHSSLPRCSSANRGYILSAVWRNILLFQRRKSLVLPVEQDWLSLRSPRVGKPVDILTRSPCRRGYWIKSGQGHFDFCGIRQVLQLLLVELGLLGNSIRRPCLSDHTGLRNSPIWISIGYWQMVIATRKKKEETVLL